MPVALRFCCCCWRCDRKTAGATEPRVPRAGGAEVEAEGEAEGEEEPGAKKPIDSRLLLLPILLLGWW